MSEISKEQATAIIDRLAIKSHRLSREQLVFEIAKELDSTHAEGVRDGKAVSQIERVVESLKRCKV